MHDRPIGRVAPEFVVAKSSELVERGQDLARGYAVVELSGPRDGLGLVVLTGEELGEQQDLGPSIGLDARRPRVERFDEAPGNVVVRR